MKMATNVLSDTFDKERLKKCPASSTTKYAFFLQSAHQLKWGDLSQSTVMDVGCGTESLEMFKFLFPNVYKVICLDISEKYIQNSKSCQSSANMEYHVADITCRNSLTKWESQISKLVSFYLLNVVPDKRSALENICYLLKPGGEAIILTGLKNPHYNCARYLLNTPKWKEFEYLVQIFPDHYTHDTGINFYTNILSDLQFEVISCKEELRFLSFPTEELFKASELTKDNVITKHLPLNLQEEFKEEYLQALMTLDGRSPNGEPGMCTSTARIIVRKTVLNG